ncbi:MAG: AMP-dependent synthetase [Lentisphaerae bacterium]|nr:AMP-dependent synthetase [Lentisphaerota bacterium]
MKLSFSTNRWNNYSFDQFIDIADEYRFQGIEIHDVHAVFDVAEPGKITALYRRLMEKRLAISCIDLVADVVEAEDAALEELVMVLDAAKRLHAPYVRIKTVSTAENVMDAMRKFLSAALPAAEKNNTVLLIETVGAFADTAKLRKVFENFISDHLAALWDLHYPFRMHGEAPEETIRNLGAYVRHVHMKDSESADKPTLVGEGSLPIESIMNALRSVNYDGFISIEWDPVWDEVSDIDIIFPHFISYMSRYELARMRTVLYDNNARTGKYVWKKETLIEKTFSQVLDTMVREFPDHLAFKYTTLDYTRTYSEFRDDVDQFARSLIALGVKPGSHVAVWMTNLPQWYIAFWATTKIGAVLVTVNTAYKIAEAEYLLKQSDTHTLILEKGWRDSDYSGIIAQLCPELANTVSGAPLHASRLPFLRNVITVGYRQKGAITWEDALLRAKSVPVEELQRRADAVDIHDVCNMQYTSGTTGFPKGVMLTHYGVVNNGKCIGDRMDLSTADRMMIEVPMFHCFGMVLAMTASMTHGATLLPLPYFSAKPALACINQEKITCFHGVPTMFIALLGHPDFPKTDFSCMRTGIMAGSPCPISVMQDVINKMNMTEITIVYGQTEASPGCTMSTTSDPIEDRVATVGRDLPEIENRIIDPETGKDLPDNEIGEFVTRGYHVMKGYYKMPRETAAAIDADGWLHTGDLALRTPEGNYKITGRLKDMIIRGGENIYPKEIEEFIYTHSKVEDVQVIGIPDKQLGEEILAAVILKPGETMTAAELQDYVRQNMAKHKVPRYVDFVEAFPQNAAGKILKYKMREDAARRLNIAQVEGIVAN